MIHEITNPENAAPLFGNWEETLIWSCLQGVMGRVYGNHPIHPDTAMATLGDFSFFAGRPDREFASYRPAGGTPDLRILVPRDTAWRDLILDIYGARARLASRYAIRKEPHVFHRAGLEQAFSSLPKGYTLCRIEESLYHKCLAEDWSRDLVSQFPTYDAYQRLGLGVVALSTQDGSIVSGASSYSRYRGGIEIEVDTRSDCRRRGLAYACAARLILECLDRGLYPSWDAQNLYSVALAEKLGYHFSHAYEAVEVLHKLFVPIASA